MASYIRQRASHLRGSPSHCRHQRFVYLLLKCSGDGSLVQFFVKQSSLKEMMHFLSHTLALHELKRWQKREAGKGLLTVSQRCRVSPKLMGVM